MADVTLAVSLGVRAEEPACTNSKVCWSMVGSGFGADFFFWEALETFLLRATLRSPAWGVAATVANNFLWGGGGGGERAVVSVGAGGSHVGGDGGGGRGGGNGGDALGLVVRGLLG